jgi:nucleoside-triphosphatase THEP1
MTLNIRDFYKTVNPSQTLDVSKAADRKLYIDFSSVRGDEIIEEMRDSIAFYSPDEPTCELFTGHIGCGKSTELLRLKQKLEQDGFFVVYFESSEDLDMADVDIGDVLLAIAKRVGESIKTLKLGQPDIFRDLLQKAERLMLMELEIPGAEVSVPGVGSFSYSLENGVALATSIGKIAIKAKNDSILRDRLNQFLGPQKTRLLDAINKELLKPAIAQLKQQGKKGLVVMMDNLDRVDNRPKAHGRPQQEHLFIDQSDCFTGLACHTIYTMPLALKFSSEYGHLTQRYKEDPRVLSMVPIQRRDGSECEDGMVLLRQMVLVRAFPDMPEAERLAAIPTVFDRAESLDRLCRASGGHVRDLLRLLSAWIKKSRRQLPLTAEMLEQAIRERRNEMSLQISPDEWNLLQQVRQTKTVGGDTGYKTLIHSRLVFEYRDQGVSWFDVNPLLLDAKDLSV